MPRRNNLPSACVYIIGRVSPHHTVMKKRLGIPFLLLVLVAIIATSVHLYLDRWAWSEHGESPLLWDWQAAVMDGRLPWAVAQYVAIAGAFALAWIGWDCKWRPQRYILLTWGITWIPVALISSADVTASSAGPFNFPMSMFAAPIFGLFCIAEAVFILLLNSVRPASSKISPLSQILKRKSKEPTP